MTFTEYCTANNIKLQQADIVFIKKQLQRLPEEHRKAVVKRYTEIWVTTRDATKRSVAAQNAARFAANTWLRGIVSGEVVLDARG
jgi:hypothetical protein